MLAQRRSQAFEIEAIPENLYREPVDYLYADHFRQRVVCDLLDALAQDPRASDVAHRATVALGYLENELHEHVLDEEQELFPALRARCEPSDNIESILTLLSEEHVRDEELNAALLEGLRSLTEDEPPPDGLAFVRDAAAFTEAQRRHLAWEERVVLPLARARLSPADLARIGRSMAARRGIDYPAEDADGGPSA